jgi:hypothetical protein
MVASPIELVRRVGGLTARVQPGPVQARHRRIGPARDEAQGCLSEMIGKRQEHVSTGRLVPRKWAGYRHAMWRWSCLHTRRCCTTGCCRSITWSGGATVRTSESRRLPRHSVPDCCCSGRAVGSFWSGSSVTAQSLFYTRLRAPSVSRSSGRRPGLWSLSARWTSSPRPPSWASSLCSCNSCVAERP